MKKLIVLSIILAAAAAVLYRCRYHRPGPVVIARVESSVLTLDEMNAQIPPEIRPFLSKSQYIDYLKRWINTEILYHEALRRGLDKEPAVARRLRQASQDLLAGELSSRLSLEPVPVSDAELQNYYSGHAGQFKRGEPEVKILGLRVKMLKDAWNIRNQVTPDNFLALARQYSLDSVMPRENLAFQTRNDLLPEVAEVVFATRIGGTTSPIKVPDGYLIANVVDKQLEGTPREFAAVREQVKSLVLAQKQKDLLENSLAALRQQMLVEYHLDLLPGLEEKPGEPARSPASRDTT